MRHVAVCEKMRILSMSQSYDQSTSSINSSHNKPRFHNCFDQFLRFGPLESIRKARKMTKKLPKVLRGFLCCHAPLQANALYLVSLFRAWSELNFGVWNVCNKLCLEAQWCAEKEQNVINMAYAQSICWISPIFRRYPSPGAWSHRWIEHTKIKFRLYAAQRYHSWGVSAPGRVPHRAYLIRAISGKICKNAKWLKNSLRSLGDSFAVTQLCEKMLYIWYHCLELDRN